MQNENPINPSENATSVPSQLLQQVPPSAPDSASAPQVGVVQQFTASEPGAGMTPVVGIVSEASPPAAPTASNAWGAPGRKKWSTLRLVTLITFPIVIIAACAVGYFIYGSSSTSLRPAEYVSAGGTHFGLNFYPDYTTRKAEFYGYDELVSKVSKDGKRPITLSIVDSDVAADFDRLRTCANGKAAVMTVANKALKQDVVVCDLGKLSDSGAGTVYKAGFEHGNKQYAVLIGNAVSEGDTKGQSEAEIKSSFGLQVYDNDIKAIISSIGVK